MNFAAPRQYARVRPPSPPSSRLQYMPPPTPRSTTCPRRRHTRSHHCTCASSQSPPPARPPAQMSCTNEAGVHRKPIHTCFGGLMCHIAEQAEMLAHAICESVGSTWFEVDKEVPMRGAACACGRGSSAGARGGATVMGRRVYKRRQRDGVALKTRGHVRRTRGRVQHTRGRGG
ncbi:hypothetical protein DENSPDRAFT_846358 [Dentipellis sp. KUC8613]|nr:hypothetical protein DENSPDRAFT_846358 [Dentipellis sp. KUC8613]